MTWYADLSECDYFSPEAAKALRAVGWLERGRDYRTGEISAEVYSRLMELLRGPMQPVAIAGPHSCDLCRFSPEAHGAANLFVPGDGVLYVCPELITHYINAHGYAPPDEFCTAVMACPDTRSMDYKRLLLKNGGRVLIGGQS